ncbi:MAG: hypothetical protein KC897_10145 [Candidatus Omnitrophica bacterium]|nr:hypothetical protein [Candidatus Omnitrophota bacterium]MCB9719410.1 hypothetical protein [Candidatus Omnitrophota bacterium]
MKRIGMAASRISKGDVRLYNIYVVLISVTFSILLFFIAGMAVILAIGIIMVFGPETMTQELRNNWQTVTRMCVQALLVAVLVFNVVGMVINMKIVKRKK